MGCSLISNIKSKDLEIGDAGYFTKLHLKLSDFFYTFTDLNSRTAANWF